MQIKDPGFSTSSNPDKPGSVLLQFYEGVKRGPNVPVVKIELSPEQARKLGEAILDSRSKYLPGGAKVQ